MRLGEKQELFARLYAEHIVWLYLLGYRVRLGDVFAHDGHRNDSNHYIKLAGDINLFKDGRYLTETEDHRVSGERWESRHDLCRWGGNWDKDDHPGEPGEDDGNHYSLFHHGRM
ncbi:hypothetical protein LCGC14_1887600 [marine sediment metagenome]|uniref:Peptidase M15C domain-containing protein n=1 Tax=marine sediment metagenome TaxID=412755 RepID=A0A0F9G0M7_9ZZZZ